MGLKALLTNLEQGVQSYPNSNTPSTSGGFNYGAGSIFNTKSFNQRTLEFGKGTAYDRPGQEFSSEPLIGRNIEIPAPNDQPSSFLGLIDGLSDGLVRGGITTALSRSAKDVARITKFYLTSRGIGFLTKQIGLQASNPNVEGGGTEISAFGIDLNLKRNRTFNLGANLIAQAGVNFSGVHLDRAGATPIWPENQKYEKTVLSYANEAGIIKNNQLENSKSRILTLHKSIILGESETSSSEQSALGQFITGLTNTVQNITGQNQDLLYEYNGGPNSLYGIGKTSIRRYDNTNFDESPTPVRFSGHDLGLSNSTNIQNFLLTSEKPGFNYQADALGGRKYYRESRIGTGNPGVGVGRDNERSDSYIQQKNSDGTLNYNVYNASRVDLINALDVFETEGNVNIPGVRDLIRFRFEAVNSENPNKSNVMVFRAFLDSFSDGYNANYNEFNYNGRGESFYTYNSFNRDINLSFKIAAQSRHEMMPLYRKLNYLVSNTAPEYSPTGRMRTPFMRLTVGSWCDRLPGVLKSVNLTWQKDYPWEISVSGPEGGNDKHMVVLPHVLDVSVSYQPIHNFLPEKSINAPFILPHPNNRNVIDEQKWYDIDVAKTVDEARKLGIERLQDKYPNVTTPTKI